MTQPKDMEQLKKEARKYAKNNHFAGYQAVFLFDVIELINKAHRSGRESMRNECVEGAFDWEPTDEWYEDLSHDAEPAEEVGASISSALKKIKL